MQRMNTILRGTGESAKSQIKVDEKTIQREHGLDVTKPGKGCPKRHVKIDFFTGCKPWPILGRLSLASDSF